MRDDSVDAVSAGIMARYGKALENGFNIPEYDEQELAIFLYPLEEVIVEDVSVDSALDNLESYDLLEPVTYEERTMPDGTYYRLKVENDADHWAEKAWQAIRERYDGDGQRFREEFDEIDRELFTLNGMPFFQ